MHTSACYFSQWVPTQFFFMSLVSKMESRRGQQGQHSRLPKAGWQTRVASIFLPFPSLAIAELDDTAGSQGMGPRLRIQLPSPGRPLGFQEAWPCEKEVRKTHGPPELTPGQRTQTHCVPSGWKHQSAVHARSVSLAGDGLPVKSRYGL